MRKVLLAAALGLVATIVAAPSGAAPAGKTVCTGTIGAIVVDEILVPTGATCVLQGTEVRRNATAEPDSRLFIDAAVIGGKVKVGRGAETGAFGAQIGKNYECHECQFEDVVGTTVGGSVKIKGESMGSFIDGSTIGKDVEIVDSAAGDFVFAVLDSTIGGNLKLRKNTGPVVVARSVIDGHLELRESDVTGCFDDPDNGPGCDAENGTITGSTIGKGAKIEKNTGPIEILNNSVGDKLDCKHNDPAPTGSGNTAKEKKGQCASL